MFSAVQAQKKWANDADGDAIALLEAVSNGWNPPDSLSESEYRRIKSDSDEYPRALVGFAAFGCSYAAKKWGGYARGLDRRGRPRNYAGEQKRALLRQRDGLSGARYTSLDYKSLDIPGGSTVYCDPPYKGTTGYAHQIDHEEFWAWCEGLLRNNCRVFVSEYEAPSGWEAVWERRTRSSLTKASFSKFATEKLFTKGG